MPALRCLGRAWRIASDELVLPGVSGMLLCLAWSIVLLVLLPGTQLESAPGCQTPIDWFGVTLVMTITLLLSVAALGWLAYESSRGTVFEVSKRKRVPWAIYVLCCLCLTLMATLLAATASFVGDIDLEACLQRNGAVARALDPIVMFLVVVIGSWVFVAGAVATFLLAYSFRHHADSNEGWRRRVHCYARICGWQLPRNAEFAEAHSTIEEWEREGPAAAMVAEESSATATNRALERLAAIAVAVLGGGDLVLSDAVTMLRLVAVQQNADTQRAPWNRSLWKSDCGDSTPGALPDTRSAFTSRVAEVGEAAGAERVWQRRGTDESQAWKRSVSGLASDGGASKTPRGSLHGALGAVVRKWRRKSKPWQDSGAEGHKRIDGKDLSSTRPEAVVPEARRYMAYAEAIYGAPLQMYKAGVMNCACCGVAAHLCCRAVCADPCAGRGDGLDEPAQRGIMIEAILQAARMRRQDLLFVSQANSALGQVPFLIALDWPTKSVVVAIRGTGSVADAITDIMCDTTSLDVIDDVARDAGLLRDDGNAASGPAAQAAARSDASGTSWRSAESFHVDLEEGRSGRRARFAEPDTAGESNCVCQAGDAAEPRYGHAGFVAVARNILRALLSGGVLQDVLGGGQSFVPPHDDPAFAGPNAPAAVGEPHGWRLVVTGHSLGAGIAVLLSTTLHRLHPTMVCFAYGTPAATIDPATSRGQASHVVSVVAGKDVVPRLNVATVRRLRLDMVEAGARMKMNKTRVLLATLRGRRIPYAEAFRSDEDVPAEARAALREFREDVLLNPGRSDAQLEETLLRPLVPGGRVLFLQPLKDVRPGILPRVRSSLASLRPSRSGAPSTHGGVRQSASGVQDGPMRPVDSAQNSRVDPEQPDTPGAGQRGKRNAFVPRWLEARELTEQGIQLSPRMLWDHFPHFYAEALQKCVSDVPAVVRPMSLDAPKMAAPPADAFRAR
ncbi:unnamed protein product [Pedinophyceae sp. YPF-701]|nr:unnamed protein product [Pedinophyceae sp. YPF-701]